MPVGAQPFQRALDLVVGLGPSTFTGLGGEKELVAVSLHPGPESQLCVAVTCGGVDVVDPMFADHLDRLIRLVLADVANGGSAEDDAGALDGRYGRTAGQGSWMSFCPEAHRPRLLLTHVRRSANSTGIWRSVFS